MHGPRGVLMRVVDREHCVLGRQLLDPSRRPTTVEWLA